MTDGMQVIYTEHRFTVPEYLWFRQYAKGDGMTVEQYIEDMVKRFVKETKPMTEE